LNGSSEFLGKGGPENGCLMESIMTVYFVLHLHTIHSESSIEPLLCMPLQEFWGSDGAIREPNQLKRISPKQGAVAAVL